MLGPAFGLRISYQRTPACTPVETRLTEWLSTSDSWSPKLRYARRNIRRSPNPSRPTFVPGCGMQERVPPHNWLYAATGRLVGPLNVELPGVAQSVWNLKK